jgi:RNA polymerase sigma factor (sigma-70 family)
MSAQAEGILAAPAGASGDAVAGTFENAGFEELFRRYYPILVRIVCRMTGDGAQAEEIAGESLFRLYRRGIASHSDSNPGGWLYRTATRLAFDALRVRNRRARYEDDRFDASAQRAPASESPEAIAERRQRQARVRAVLASLKPKRARLLLLRSFGSSYGEMAQLMDVKRSSIGKLLARAEEEFAREYTRRYGEELQVPDGHEIPAKVSHASEGSKLSGDTAQKEHRR